MWILGICVRRFCIPKIMEFSTKRRLRRDMMPGKNIPFGNSWLINSKLSKNCTVCSIFPDASNSTSPARVALQKTAVTNLTRTRTAEVDVTHSSKPFDCEIEDAALILILSQITSKSKFFYNADAAVATSSAVALKIKSIVHSILFLSPIMSVSLRKSP